MKIITRRGKPSSTMLGRFSLRNDGKSHWAPILGGHGNVHIYRLFLAGLAAIGAWTCLDDESENLRQSPLPASSYPSVIEHALSTMENLSSYHVTVTPSPPSGDPLRSTYFEVGFVAPDIYSVTSSQAGGETRQVCRTYSAGGTWSEACREVLTTVTGHAILEAVWNSDRIWFRKCGVVVSACTGEWGEIPYTPADAPHVGPPFASLPSWPLEAVKAAKNVELTEAEAGSESRLHFRAQFNPVRAFLEAESAFYGDEPMAGGGSCIPAASVNFGDDTRAVTEGQCRSRDGEYLKELAEKYDAQPLPIDIWLSPTQDTIERIVAVIREPTDAESEIHVAIEYSRLNGVEIKIPPEE